MTTKNSNLTIMSKENQCTCDRKFSAKTQKYIDKLKKFSKNSQKSFSGIYYVMGIVGIGSTRPAIDEIECQVNSIEEAKEEFRKRGGHYETKYIRVLEPTGPGGYEKYRDWKSNTTKELNEKLNELGKF